MWHSIATRHVAVCPCLCFVLGMEIAIGSRFKPVYERLEEMGVSRITEPARYITTALRPIVCLIPTGIQVSNFKYVFNKILITPDSVLIAAFRVSLDKKPR